MAIVLLAGMRDPSGVAAAGECEAAGLMSVGGTGLCTHGPDPAPPGVAPSVADAEEIDAAADLSLAVCTGNGTDGRRVQALCARPTGAPDRLAKSRLSFRRWSAQASQIFTDRAA